MRRYFPHALMKKLQIQGLGYTDCCMAREKSWKVFHSLRNISGNLCLVLSHFSGRRYTIKIQINESYYVSNKHQRGETDISRTEIITTEGIFGSHR